MIIIYAVFLLLSWINLSGVRLEMSQSKAMYNSSLCSTKLPYILAAFIAMPFGEFASLLSPEKVTMKGIASIPTVCHISYDAQPGEVANEATGAAHEEGKCHLEIQRRITIFRLGSCLFFFCLPKFISSALSLMLFNKIHVLGQNFLHTSTTFAMGYQKKNTNRKRQKK